MCLGRKIWGGAGVSVSAAMMFAGAMAVVRTTRDRSQVEFAILDFSSRRRAERSRPRSPRPHQDLDRLGPLRPRAEPNVNPLFYLFAFLTSVGGSS
jgi:hypothetical protein